MERETAARALAKKKQDAFCGQLDNHLKSIQKVSALSQHKLETEVQSERKEAEKAVAEVRARGQRALVAAEEDLAVKGIKLKHLKAQHKAAEVGLSSVKLAMKAKLAAVKRHAAALVKNPQHDTQELFEHAKQGMREMQKELFKQEQKVQKVARMFELGREKEQTELGMASEVLEMTRS